MDQRYSKGGGSGTNRRRSLSVWDREVIEGREKETPAPKKKTASKNKKKEVPKKKAQTTEPKGKNLWTDIKKVLKDAKAPLRSEQVVQALIVRMDYPEGPRTRTRVYNSLARWAKNGTRVKKLSRGLYELA